MNSTYYPLKKYHKSGTTQRQSGVVLAICLVVLLALTMIGISGVQTTGLQENLVANAKDSNLAFQAAETALKEVEYQITGLKVPDQIATQFANGYYDVSNTNQVPVDPQYYKLAVTWSTATKHLSLTGNALANLTGLAQPPDFIIERLKTDQSVAGGSLEVSMRDEPTTDSYYRITARGTGSNPNAVVLVQSIYVP